MVSLPVAAELQPCSATPFTQFRIFTYEQGGGIQDFLFHAGMTADLLRELSNGLLFLGMSRFFHFAECCLDPSVFFQHGRQFGPEFFTSGTEVLCRFG